MKLLYSRRDALYLVGAGTASLYLSGCATLGAGKNSRSLPQDWLSTFGPVDRTLPDIVPRVFSGDQPDLAHEVLWKKSEFVKSIGGLPPVTEEVPLVIVGGGMSGLLSAYFLREHRPVVLEQAARFGGNSRAESWRGLDYSLATAYFAVPEENSSIDRFLKELGIDKIMRARSTNDPIFIDGIRYDDFWTKGTVSETRSQFTKLNKLFLDTIASTNGGQYPEIPSHQLNERKYVNRLDKMSFKLFLESYLKEPLHPHVEAVIEGYFWSACASSSTEVSAAAGLNFFSAEFGEIAMTPGGNAAILEALLRNLTSTVPQTNLRASALVFDVRVHSKGVQVSYLQKGQPKTVQAKAVILSCPKFVATRLIDDLEPERKKIISGLRYRSYMLANALIDHSLKDSFYDLFFFKSGEILASDVLNSAPKKRVTDVVYGNFAQPNRPQTVLTFFRGFPYDKARNEIYAPDAYTKYRKEFEDQIQNEALPMLGLSPRQMADLRISRWGHPLPLAEVGTFSSGKPEILRRPFRERVFFVEQDNWMLPAFETCFLEAEFFAPQIRKWL